MTKGPSGGIAVHGLAGAGPVVTRRTILRGMGAGVGLYFLTSIGGRPVAIEAQAMEYRPGEAPMLDPAAIPKWATPLLIPPVMPRSGTARLKSGKNADSYEISVRQFDQQILPAGLPPTTVWGYGAVSAQSRRGLLIHNAPSLTIEAAWNRPVRVRWINDLRDAEGAFLPHLLPVDPTLHWANPPGGTTGRDTRPPFSETPGPYTGPVPLVTHVHGAVGVGDASDGYAEAWYLPDATDVPAGYATEGTWFEFFRDKAMSEHGVQWPRGSAVFVYPNDQRATTNWYHDHTLGMTRLNVYAGPAGFFIIRGGPAGDSAVLDSRTGLGAVLPGPGPKENDAFPPNKTYYEVPLAIQDRSFTPGGQLFYPDTREYFDGVAGPYIPETDISPIWNPEFFGNAIMVNGNTWPFHTVEQRRYRFRLLNGCNSRFLILDFTAIPGVKAWQIGAEGGFLAAPVDVMDALGGRLLMAPAERADVIVDFTDVPLGDHVLGNVGPDEPFGGGVPGVDFPVAEPGTTGSILQWRVVPTLMPDPTTPPEFLVLPPIVPDVAVRTRRLALIEEMSADFEDAPAAALLGTVDDAGHLMPHMWSEAVTENPGAGDVEVWEFYNATADAHPIHVHEVVFQVLDRQALEITEDMGGMEMGEGDEHATAHPIGDPWPPELTESGWKDTVIAYPGEVTRVRMKFTKAGQYVWHCHIVEHEDNEMMRPLRIGPLQPGQPPDGPSHHM